MILASPRAWRLALALVLAPGAAASAGTKLKYIQGAPALTLEVPDGWTAEEDRYNIVHQLDFRPNKGAVPYRVQMFYFPIGDTEHPQQFLGELAGLQAKNDELTHVGYEPFEEQVSHQKITMTRLVMHGRRKGVDCGYVFYFFVVKNHGYVMAVNGADATLPGAGTVTLAVLNSIRPLKGK